MVTTQKHWERCLQIIKDNLSQKEYETWFVPVVPLRYEAQVLALQVPSMFIAEVLENKYFDLLSKAIQRVFGADTILEYHALIDKSTNTSTTIPGEKHAVTTGNVVKNNTSLLPPINSQLNASYNFDALVEGMGNKLARNAGITIAKAPGKTAFNPLFIYGKSGVGKTHLANAIGLMTKQLNPNARVLYVPANTFQIQYTDAVRNNRQIDFLNFYQTIDVLIVDDIQEYIGKTATQNTFFHIFNHLHQAGKQLVLTSDRSPMELEGMEERLLTRFKWGLLAELEKPDYTLRKDILKSKIYRDGLTISDEVVEFIAKNVTESVRDLEGVLISIMAHSTLTNAPIDLDLARKVMSNVVTLQERTINIKQIRDAVCEYFALPVSAIETKSRKREVVQARQIAMYLAKQLTSESLAAIGKAIGQRDHATVMHACNVVSDQIDIDKNFRLAIQEIESKIKS